ncbi:MAG: hypothetical protein KAH07_03510 [Flavobacteriaceae bacterium]|nr:hypothetical protein [Flavobacteriaceae bacterium]
MTAIKIKHQIICKISIGLLFVSLATFYFTGGLSKLIYRSDWGLHRYVPVIKGLFEIFVLGYAVLTLRKVKAYVLLITAIIIGSLLIGQFFLSLKYEGLNFIDNFVLLFWGLGSCFWVYNTIIAKFITFK